MPAVNTPHPEVAKMRPRWQAIEDFCEGEYAVHSAGTTYLPKLPGHAVEMANGVVIDDYACYLARAHVLPYADPLVNRMVGMVFRKAPQAEVPATIRDEDAGHDELKNVTLTGVTLEGFAKDLVRENITTGFGCVLVDWSKEMQRPYLRMYRAEQVVSWWMEIVAGVAVLRRIVLQEHVVEPDPQDPYLMACVEQYRVVEMVDEKCQHTTWRWATTGEGKGDFIQHGELVIPERVGEPLAFLPVVPFNPFSTTLEIHKPPMENLVTLLWAWYLNSADYEELLHKASAGLTLLISGLVKDEQALVKKVGAGSLIMASNPDAGGEYIQTEGSAGAEILAAMQAKESQMAIAAGRLILSQQKNVAESAAAQDMQFASDDANLQGVSGASAMALEQALSIYAWWHGKGVYGTVDDVGKDVTVELNDRFTSGRITADEIVRLGLEVDAGRWTLEQYWYAVFQVGERGIPGQTFEEYMAALDRGGMAVDTMAPVPGLSGAKGPEERTAARRERADPHMHDGAVAGAPATATQGR